MAQIKPFRAFRPTKELAAKVASPPYDVLNSAEARIMAAGNPYSYLHVVKPEIDLPEATGLYSDEVYAKAASNLQQFIADGVLVRDKTPSLYIYRQKMGDHVQVGIVAGSSVEEYDSGIIKKHEKTRQNKEDDRTRHVDSLNANAGPVFLTYRHQNNVDAIVEEICSGEHEYDFVADDGIGHTFWVVSDEAKIAALQTAFADIDFLYIADGHHRSASASRVAALRKAANPAHTGAEEYNFFLTVIFPDNQMKILDYNRVILDLNGLAKSEFLAQVADKFEVVECAESKPSKATEFTMNLDGTWYRLNAKAGTFPADDPVEGLDVSILQTNLLNPILGIGDPRTDNRIDFVGGIRGMSELSRRVAAGDALAFALYPTSMDQLMNIADADEIMPPKSTWFEPKLRSGLVTRPLYS